VSHEKLLLSHDEMRKSLEEVRKRVVRPEEDRDDEDSRDRVA
jgi:hypothetical protein